MDGEGAAKMDASAGDTDNYAFESDNYQIIEQRSCKLSVGCRSFNVNLRKLSVGYDATIEIQEPLKMCRRYSRGNTVEVTLWKLTIGDKTPVWLFSALMDEVRKSGSLYMEHEHSILHRV